MAFNRLEVNDLSTATLDDSDQVIIGESNTFKKATVSALKNNILGSSPSYTTDTEPYLMRRTAHTGVVGKCALEKLAGGSLGWNQLIPQTTATASQNGVNYASTGNGTWTITGALESGQTQGWYNLNYTANVQKILSGHVYYARGCDAEMRLQLVGNAVLATFEAEKIVKVTLGASDTSTWVRFQTLTHATLNKTLTPQVLDLTAMFGSTIADYIYSLELATAGAGVAWLSKYIDLGTYHAYDAGSIKSVQATAHVTKDANDNVIGNYSLGSDTLRGIPQLVSNKLQFDGDEKYPDGTIKRKYGSRAYQSGDTSDGATMITDGTTTVYKLATPTTESSTSYQKIQTIDADGTESFTTSSPVPVGHETQTPDNILAALSWVGE